MKTVKASLDVKIFVECPSCYEFLDLLNPDDTDNCNHDEFYFYDVTCGKCKTKFNVDGMVMNTPHSGQGK